MRWRRRLLSVALAATFLFSVAPVEAADAGKRFAKVKWVIDGDTFDTERDERIRLIGVDAPEYRPWKNRVDPGGKEASDYAKKLLAGKKIQLESDVDKKDKYGRTLAYVYLENGVFVNYHLISEGVARAKYYKPNGKYKTKLKEAEKKAKAAGKGLWKGKVKKKTASKKTKSKKVAAVS